MLKQIILPAFAALIIAGCASTNNISQDEFFNLPVLKSNLEFLASDELEGREAATHGAKVASKFIASELQKYGVEPFGDDGTYFQNFEVQLNSIDSNSNVIFKNGDAVIEFKFINDFIKVYYTLPAAINPVSDKEIIFAGYGITADEFDYDDYKNLDVKGKVVVVFAGEPFSETETFFNGEKNTRYARSSAKIEIAIAKGASGIIILPDEYTLSRWERFGRWSASESFQYNPEGETSSNETIPAALLSEKAAKELLQNQKYTFEQLTDLIAEHQSLPYFHIDGKIDMNLIVNSRTEVVRNVVGLIKGTDPSLQNEYVTIGAHYDHEGIKNNEIYNGANDNASGTSAVLETARTLAASKSNKRPVVILLYTAEEKGLIGAKHFTSHSSIIDDVIVNINLDMLGSGHPDTVYSIGSGRLSSELYKLANEVNASVTKFAFDYKYDDPNDPERIYYRSDHYQFAKRGIPSVFFTVDDPYNYHQPTDDAEHINFKKVLRAAKLVYHLALRIANLDHKLVVDVPQTAAE